MTTSTDTPSVDWLARADIPDLAGRSEDAARALRAMLRDLPVLPEPVGGGHPVVAALDNVLRACSEETPRGLVESAAKSIAFPALRLTQALDLWSFLGAAVRLCAQRPALQSAVAIQRLLEEGLRAAREDEETLPDAASLSIDVPDDLDWSASLVMEHTSTYDSSALAAAWTSRRLSLPLDHRWAVDAALLSRLIVSKQRVPVALAEALYEEDCWRSPHLRGWVNDLSRPLQDSEVGVASAALLNTRIRDLKPQLFLRHPDVLVVDAVSSSVAQHDVRSEVARDLGDLLHRARLKLTEEAERPSPRKRPLTGVASMLESCLSRIGLEPLGAAGASLEFDPLVHLGDEDLHTGEEVLVRRPGLRDIESGAVVIRAGVVRPHDGTTTNEEIDHNG